MHHRRPAFKKVDEASPLCLRVESLLPGKGEKLTRRARRSQRVKTGSQGAGWVGQLMFSETP